MRSTYTNVAATAALVFCVAGTAIASSGGRTSAAEPVTKVCADDSGNLSLPTAKGTCRRHGRVIRLAGGPKGATGQTGVTGAQGPAGAQGSAGVAGAQGSAGPAGSPTQLTSPDGKFSIVVSNAGITLSGPNSSLKLTDHDLVTEVGGSTTMSSGTKTAVTSGTATEVTSGTTTTVSTGLDLALTAGRFANVVAQDAVEVDTNGTVAVTGSHLNLGGTSGCVPVARLGGTVQSGVITAGSGVVSAC